MVYVILMGSGITQLGDKEIDSNEMNYKPRDHISGKTA